MVVATEERCRKGPVLFAVPTMKNFFTLTAAILVSLGCQSSKAAVYIDFDGDIATSETSVLVASGTPVILKAIFSADGPPPVIADVISLSLSFTGTAVAAFTDVKAGPVAGLGGGGASFDTWGIAPVAPGDSLTPFFAGPGLIDSTGYEDPGLAFGGLFGMPGLGVPHDLLGWEFTITGAPGDSVTFVPGGGFDSAFGASGPSAPGSDMFGVFATPGSGFTPASVSGITITIVPEPSTSLLAGLGIAGLLFRRRR